MAEGQERRAVVEDSLRGQHAAEPVTRGGVQQLSANNVQVPAPTASEQVLGALSQFSRNRLAEITSKRQEASVRDGRIAALQGRTLESLDMEGDKWAIHGHGAVTAQSMAAGLLRAQEHEIDQGAYELNVDDYRERLNSRIQNMLDPIKDPIARKIAEDELLSQVPTLVDAHTRRHMEFTENQAFDVLANSLDVLSRDQSKTEHLVSFANGTSAATAGLSTSRRREAVTQGVINAFTNNNPAAFAKLKQAGLLTTENLTATQLSRINSAKTAYHVRMEQEVNKDWLVEDRRINKEIQMGNLDPVAAYEAIAENNAKHGRRTSSAQAGTIYDAAVAGVDFAEGTRRLNIQAAGVSGDYKLQAKLMKDAVIQQESRGNPDAVSPKGASGIMQLMPNTMINPGFGVRNIFQVANDLGIPVTVSSKPGNSTMVNYQGKWLTPLEAATALSKDPNVNETMGTEYLETMLDRYNGDVERALVAYNWGPGNADNWDGDHSKLPAETQQYVKNITSSWGGDDRDPRADRLAAEALLEEYRDQARLDVLEQIGPAMAENDEAFMLGFKDMADWRQERQNLYGAYGLALDEQRINQEQQMLRSVARGKLDEIKAGLKEQADIQTANTDAINAATLETLLATADQNYDTLNSQIVAGQTDVTPAAASAQYMNDVLSAFTSVGVPLDASTLSAAARKGVEDAAATGIKALKASEENAIIGNAFTAQTGGTLPQPLQDRMLEDFREDLVGKVNNIKASASDVDAAQVDTWARGQEIDFIASQGLIDTSIQQQINLAASGNWVGADGKPGPHVVAGLHSFVSIYSRNPSLAMQYVPDAKSRGRMLAAMHMVTSMLPGVDAFAEVDLSNRDDPTANAFYHAVHEVGLHLKSPPSAEETTARVAEAMEFIDSGNLSGTALGGLLSTSAADALLPDNMAHAGLTSQFDMLDAVYDNQLDRESIDANFKEHTTRFLEEVVPHMPGVSQDAAVQTALTYVRDRGAIMGSSYVMPHADKPSITQQMFPGQTVQNTAAVNSAITGWMMREETRERFPAINDAIETGFFNPNYAGVPTFSVTVRNDNTYVATTPGGSFVLPIREIGDWYIANR